MKELLGNRRASSLAPKLETFLSELENFLRGLAAVRELTPRGSDYLLSFGELLSSLIVADAFAVRGLSSAWVDSRACLVTDATFTRAVPQLKETREKCKKKVLPLLDFSPGYRNGKATDTTYTLTWWFGQTVGW